MRNALRFGIINAQKYALGEAVKLQPAQTYKPTLPKNPGDRQIEGERIKGASEPF